MKYEDINTPMQLYLFMKSNIKYGFVSSYDNIAYTRYDLCDDLLYEELLFNSYYLQRPEELLKSGYGICYDQVEFAKRWLLDNDYMVKTYFSKCHNHSFLIYKDRDTNKYNLFERSWKKRNGIYPLNSIDDSFKIYMMWQNIDNSDLLLDAVDIFEYDCNFFGVGFYEFIDLASQNSNKQLVYKK